MEGGTRTTGVYANRKHEDMVVQVHAVASRAISAWIERGKENTTWHEHVCDDLQGRGVRRTATSVVN